MKKRRLTIRTGGAACLLIGLASLVWLTSLGSRINEKNHLRIKNGMTMKEVEAILGPPRDETGGRQPAMMNCVWISGRFWMSWHYEIEVGLDDDGKVLGVVGGEYGHGYWHELQSHWEKVQKLLSW